MDRIGNFAPAKRHLTFSTTNVIAACLLVAASPFPASSNDAEAFHDLLNDSWEFRLKESPLFATRVGDHRYDDQLGRETVADHQRRLRQMRQYRQRWKEIDRASLPPADQINYDMFGFLLDMDIAEAEFHGYLMPITNREGFHVTFAGLPERWSLQTPSDYENYIARLQAFPQWVEDHIELMREGIRQGMVLPKVVLEGSESSVTAHIVDRPEDSLFYQPLKEFPRSVPAGRRSLLRQAASKAILDSVIPGYRKFLDFLQNEYIPACRDSIGASELPNGRAFYRHRVRLHSTLDITPEEVHEIGMGEVQRIRGEMLRVMKRAEFEGTLPEFVAMLRTDPRFYAETPEELLKETALVLKRMDGELPRLFRHLPRTPYGIREIPAYIAPKTTTAYYQPPPGDGSQAGFYFINTYDLKSRPLYEIEALSLHEAVPGHHLQIALQQELTDLPPFRRFTGITAYVEGWALYAERLGLEAGFYQDPYRDFGRLTYEMWRACRLVVDTGIHYLGWSRQQAIDFMAEQTALSLHNIEAEVDRYIAWPGQALGYKLGELKIRELRRRAEQKMGPQFDLREFHDVILRNGAVPLPILEASVDQYINGR